jgi:hypothetical protein
MDHYPLALTIFIVSLVISRLVSERGLAMLSTEQKGQIVEEMASFRKYGVVVLLVLVLLTFKTPALLVAGAFIFVTVRLALISRQTHRLSLPRGYLKFSAASTGLTLAGMCAYLLVLFAPWPF